MERPSDPTPHPPVTDPQVLAYWTLVVVVLERRLSRLAGQDADDVHQRVALQFFTDPHAVMRAYTAERFANVAARSRADDHRRAERIQRGEGARLRIDPATGLARPGREVSALDSVDPEHDRLGIVDQFDERIVDNDRLRTALRVLDPRIARLLILVEVEGHTVTDAAPMVGFTRAYANRRLSAAKALLAELITAA